MVPLQPTIAPRSSTTPSSEAVKRSPGSSALTDLIWDVPEIVQELSKLYALKAGDLIFMGTPAGVAALVPGDAFVASLDGVVELRGAIVG